MGYRQYILKIEKEEADKIRHLPMNDLEAHFKEIVAKEGYLSLHEIWNDLKAVSKYELGKYFDEETYFEMTNELFFSDKEVAKDFSDYDARILTEHAFLVIIKHYEENVKRHFDLLLTEPEMYDGYADVPREPNPIKPHKEGSRFISPDDVLQNEYITKRIVTDFLSRRRNWEMNNVINTNKEDVMLNNSWLYEYAVFDMLRLHKTADFNKYYYVIYGY